MAQFVKVRSMLVSIDHIVTIKRSKPSVGYDKVSREYVVTLSQEAEPNPKYRRRWMSAEEIAPILHLIGDQQLDKPSENAYKEESHGAE